MPSDDKKRRAAAKKAAKNKVKTSEVKENIPAEKENQAINGKPEENTVALNTFANDDEFEGSGDENEEAQKIIEEIESLNLLSDRVAQHRSVTGVLSSHRESRDLHVSSLNITFHGRELLQEAELELNNKQRYGLLGQNGCGKSTLFAVIANREVPVPPHLDIFLLQREMPPSDKTALECVMEVDEERIRLEDEAAELATLGDDPNAIDRLNDVYERLEELDADKAERIAAELLFGLGFTKDMQNKQVKHFSGGWRMRISLARALFVKPALLLLDEPTNHLDLTACVWLEKQLVEYPRCLVVISHSQDFLNSVCTNIISMRKNKLIYYGGNYDTYEQTRAEQEGNQMKLFKKQQNDIANIKEFVARFGHGTKKMARQAQSREKLLAKMTSGGLIEKVNSDKQLSFYFPDPGEIPPPVVQVQNISFRYASGKPLIYRDVELAVDLDTRVALVGPNGAGKSTLLKLIAAELEPSDGIIRRHSHVRFGRFHQHLHEKMDIRMTALQWMMKEFPEIKELDDMRKRLGRYGLTGAQQTCPIMALSDGQRCRIIFSWLAQTAPHILLLDEPTNHLDIETIDSLADAINNFEGGLLLVSHDFRLIDQVADQLWVCEHQKVTRWDGDIYSYKKYLVKTMEKSMNERQALVER